MRIVPQVRRSRVRGLPTHVSWTVGVEAEVDDDLGATLVARRVAIEAPAKRQRAVDDPPVRKTTRTKKVRRAVITPPETMTDEPVEQTVQESESEAERLGGLPGREESFGER